MQASLPAFLTRNPCFAELTRQRAVSYWSCYYRVLHASRDTYPALTALSRLAGNGNLKTPEHKPGCEQRADRRIFAFQAPGLVLRSGCAEQPVTRWRELRAIARAGPVSVRSSYVSLIM
jgi:hypothetical protein